MRICAHIVILAASAGCFGQTAEAVSQSLSGQLMLLAHVGQQSKVKLEKSHSIRIKGGCDRAVLVQDVTWKGSSIRIKLQDIGTPSIMNHRRGDCARSVPDIVIELSGFSPDEPGASISESIRQVLMTPEQYLAYNAVPFAIPTGADDETPAKAPPPITYPTVLLSVDANYTRPALSAKLKGAVAVVLIVGTDGRVHRPRVLKGLGLGLDENALRVLSLWRFEPGRQGEKRVAVQSKLEMHFNLL